MPATMNQRGRNILLRATGIPFGEPAETLLKLAINELYLRSREQFTSLVDTAVYASIGSAPFCELDPDEQAVSFSRFSILMVSSEGTQN
jgi:hypothetical protein